MNAHEFLFSSEAETFPGIEIICVERGIGVVFPAIPMAEIRILSDNVANQIAAGEVVERPMSVIKELLENAIDAGATRIVIEFRNGGKSFMSIEDNGCGMSPDQALLALERHATSKIRETADLDSIHSFGFRGEALPSIASVSNFILRTRPADAEIGAEIWVEGGKYRHCRDVGMPAGTRIEISKLFFNVPARLKFLKTENTEAAHITRCVRLYAVAHPEIAFTLWENGREIFRSPAGTDLRTRVGAIWGRQLADDLIPLCESESGGMRVWGLVGKPGVSRTSRTEMVTIVNGRPVDNRTMAYSLVESFHTLIPRGRYPLAFLFLEIDPHAVDVNVHPAKREVRFRNESAVRNLIISAVLKTVGATEDFSESVPVPAVSPVREASEAVGSERADPLSVPVPETKRDSVPIHFPAKATPLSSAFREMRALPEKNASKVVSPGGPAPEPCVRPLPEKHPVAVVSSWKTWRFIGNFDGLALFQIEKNLLVLNPRFALERIWYERALERFRKAERHAQLLLIPEPIEFDPVLADTLLQNMETLNEAGFSVEEFGRNFFRVIEVPDWLSPDADVKQCVRDLVERIARLPAEFSRGNVAHETLARIAASHATQSRNAAMGERDLRDLLSALFATSQPNVSPNGQKIFFEISRTELNRRFA